MKTFLLLFALALPALADLEVQELHQDVHWNGTGVRFTVANLDGVATVEGPLIVHLYARHGGTGTASWQLVETWHESSLKPQQRRPHAVLPGTNAVLSKICSDPLWEARVVVEKPGAQLCDVETTLFESATR